MINKIIKKLHKVKKIISTARTDYNCRMAGIVGNSIDEYMLIYKQIPAISSFENKNQNGTIMELKELKLFIKNKNILSEIDKRINNIILNSSKTIIKNPKRKINKSNINSSDVFENKTNFKIFTFFFSKVLHFRLILIFNILFKINYFFYFIISGNILKYMTLVINQIIFIKKRVFLKKNIESIRETADISFGFIVGEIAAMYFEIFKLTNTFKKWINSKYEEKTTKEQKTISLYFKKILKSRNLPYNIIYTLGYLFIPITFSIFALCGYYNLLLESGVDYFESMFWQVLKTIYYSKYYYVRFEFDMGIVKFNQFLTYFLHENSRNMGWLSRGYNLFSNEYRNQRIYQDKNPDIMLEFFFNTASDKNAENSLIYNQTYIDKLASDFIKMQVDYNIIPPSILYSQQNVASMLGNFDILKNPYNDSGNNINNYLIKRKKFLGEFYHIYGSAPINFLDIYYSKTFSKWQNVFENAEMVASSSILVDNYSDIILYKNKYTNDTSVADLFYVSDIKLGYTKGFGIDKKIQCSDILDFSEQAKLFNLFISKHSNAFFLRGSHFYDYASYGIWDIEHSAESNNTRELISSTYPLKLNYSIDGLVNDTLVDGVFYEDHDVYSDLEDTWYNDNLMVWGDKDNLELNIIRKVAPSDFYNDFGLYFADWESYLFTEEPDDDFCGYQDFNHVNDLLQISNLYNNPIFALADNDLDLESDSLHFENNDFVTNSYNLASDMDFMSGNDDIWSIYGDLDSSWDSFFYNNYLNLVKTNMFKFLNLVTFNYFNFKNEEFVSLDFLKNIANSLHLRTEDWVKLKANILLWKYWYRGNRPKISHNEIFIDYLKFNQNKLIYKFFKNIEIEKLNYLSGESDSENLFICLSNSNLLNTFKYFVNTNYTKNINIFYSDFRLKIIKNQTIVNNLNLKINDKIVILYEILSIVKTANHKNNFIISDLGSFKHCNLYFFNDFYFLKIKDTSLLKLFLKKSLLKKNSLNEFLIRLDSERDFKKKYNFLCGIKNIFNTVFFKKKNFNYLVNFLLKPNTYFRLLFDNYIFNKCSFDFKNEYTDNLFFSRNIKKNIKFIRFLLKYKDNLYYINYSKKINNLIGFKFKKYNTFLINNFKNYTKFNCYALYDLQALNNDVFNSDIEAFELIKFMNLELEKDLEKKNINFDKFLEEFLFFNSDNSDSIMKNSIFSQYNTVEILRLYIAYLHTNNTEISSFSLQISEILYNFIKFKKLLYFFYINVNNFKKLKILKKLENFNLYNDNIPLVDFKSKKIFIMYLNFLILQENNNWNTSEMPLKKNYFKNKNNYLFAFKFINFKFSKRHWYSRHSENIEFVKLLPILDYVSFSEKDFNNKFSIKTNLDFKFFLKNTPLINIFKESYYYRIFELPQITIRAQNDSNINLLPLVDFLLLKINIFDSTKNKIYSEMFENRLKFKGLKLLNHFINCGYFENSNIYLGNNLSIQNYDIPFSSLGLIALCKNFKNKVITYNYKYFWLWYNKKLRNTNTFNLNYLVFSFFYNNGLSFNKLNRDICFCLKNKKNNFLLNRFWNNFYFYNTVFKDNYYNIYLINKTKNNNLSYYPQNIYSLDNKGFSNLEYQKYDKLLLKEIKKIKREFDFKYSINYFLANTLNSAPVCLCEYNPFLGNVVFSKINSKFENDTFFYEKKYLNLVNYKYFLNNYFYNNIYNYKKTVTYIKKLKYILDKNPIYINFGIIDFLKLIHNIYFLRLRKYKLTGIERIDIPNLNVIFNNYGLNYPKYSNNVVGNFAAIVLKNYSYSLIWNYFYKWVNNEKLYQSIFEFNVKSRFSTINFKFPKDFLDERIVENSRIITRIPVSECRSNLKLISIGDNELTFNVNLEDIKGVGRFKDYSLPEPEGFDVMKWRYSVDSACGLYELRNRSGSFDITNNKLFGKIFNIYRKQYEFTGRNEKLLEKDKGLIFLNKKLKKFRTFIVNKYTTLIRYRLVFLKKSDFNIFILEYLNKELTRLKFRYLKFRINKFNFYKKNYFLFYFILNNRKLSFKFLIEHGSIFKKSPQWVNLEQMLNLLDKIYTIKLIKLQNDHFHNHFNFLKPKKIKNYVNLKNYRNLYTRYMINRFKYKKNELILEKLINNTLHDNFSTASFLRRRKPLTKYEFEKLVKWEKIVVNSNSFLKKKYIKNYYTINRLTFKNFENKNNYIKKFKKLKDEFPFDMMRFYPFSDFFFDCFVKVKSTDNSITAYPLKTYKDREIKLLLKLSKFCINLKTLNFYTNNWIKCAKISTKFNLISNKNNKSVNFFISNFKKYSKDNNLSTYCFKNCGILWVSEELPVNKNTILFIFNSIINKHIKISFFNFENILKKNRFMYFKDNLLFIYLKIYSIDKKRVIKKNSTLESFFNFLDIFYRFYYVKYNFKLRENSKKKKMSIQNNIDIILKFVYKNYFIYNLKKKNIIEIDKYGINNINLYKMIFLLNFKFNILYNFSILDKISLKKSPFLFYIKFKKVFKNVYGFDIKYFSQKNHTQIYRTPFNKNNIFLLIWEYIWNFNVNLEKKTKFNILEDTAKFKHTHNLRSKKRINKFFLENSWVMSKNYNFYLDNITFINNLYTNSNLFVNSGLSLSNNTHCYSTSEKYIKSCDSFNYKLLKNLNKQKDEFNFFSLEKKILVDSFNKNIISYKKTNSIFNYYNKLWVRNNFKNLIFSKLIKFKKIAQIGTLTLSDFRNIIITLNMYYKNIKTIKLLIKKYSILENIILYDQNNTNFEKMNEIFTFCFFFKKRMSMESSSIFLNWKKFYYSRWTTLFKSNSYIWKDYYFYIKKNNNNFNKEQSSYFFNKVDFINNIYKNKVKQVEEQQHFTIKRVSLISIYNKVSFSPIFFKNLNPKTPNYGILKFKTDKFFDISVIFKIKNSSSYLKRIIFYFKNKYFLDPLLFKKLITRTTGKFESNFKIVMYFMSNKIKKYELIGYKNKMTIKEPSFEEYLEFYKDYTKDYLPANAKLPINNFFFNKFIMNLKITLPHKIIKKKVLIMSEPEIGIPEPNIKWNNIKPKRNEIFSNVKVGVETRTNFIFKNKKNVDYLNKLILYFKNKYFLKLILFKKLIMYEPVEIKLANNNINKIFFVFIFKQKTVLEEPSFEEYSEFYKNYTKDYLFRNVKLPINNFFFNKFIINLKITLPHKIIKNKTLIMSEPELGIPEPNIKWRNKKSEYTKILYNTDVGVELRANCIFKNKSNKNYLNKIIFYFKNKYFVKPVLFKKLITYKPREIIDFYKKKKEQLENIALFLGSKPNIYIYDYKKVFLLSKDIEYLIDNKLLNILSVYSKKYKINTNYTNIIDAKSIINKSKTYKLDPDSLCKKYNSGFTAENNDFVSFSKKIIKDKPNAVFNPKILKFIKIKNTYKNFNIKINNYNKLILYNLKRNFLNMSEYELSLPETNKKQDNLELIISGIFYNADAGVDLTANSNFKNKYFIKPILFKKLIASNPEEIELVKSKINKIFFVFFFKQKTVLEEPSFEEYLEFYKNYTKDYLPANAKLGINNFFFNKFKPTTGVRLPPNVIKNKVLIMSEPEIGIPEPNIRWCNIKTERNKNFTNEYTDIEVTANCIFKNKNNIEYLNKIIFYFKNKYFLEPLLFKKLITYKPEKIWYFLKKQQQLDSVSLFLGSKPNICLFNYKKALLSAMVVEPLLYNKIMQTKPFYSNRYKIKTNIVVVPYINKILNIFKIYKIGLRNLCKKYEKDFVTENKYLITLSEKEMETKTNIFNTKSLKLIKLKNNYTNRNLLNLKKLFILSKINIFNKNCKTYLFASSHDTLFLFTKNPYIKNNFIKKLKSRKYLICKYNLNWKLFISICEYKIKLKKNKIKYFEFCVKNKKELEKLKISIFYNKHYIFKKMIEESSLRRYYKKIDVKLENELTVSYRNFIFDKKNYIFFYHKNKQNRLKCNNIKYLYYLTIYLKNIKNILQKNKFKNIFFNSHLYDYFCYKGIDIFHSNSKYNIIYRLPKINYRNISQFANYNGIAFTILEKYSNSLVDLGSKLPVNTDFINFFNYDKPDMVLFYSTGEIKYYNKKIFYKNLFNVYMDNIILKKKNNEKEINYILKNTVNYLYILKNNFFCIDFFINFFINDVVKAYHLFFTYVLYIWENIVNFKFKFILDSLNSLLFYSTISFFNYLSQCGSFIKKNVPHIQKLYIRHKQKKDSGPCLFIFIGNSDNAVNNYFNKKLIKYKLLNYFFIFEKNIKNSKNLYNNDNFTLKLKLLKRFKFLVNSKNSYESLINFYFKNIFLYTSFIKYFKNKNNNLFGCGRYEIYQKDMLKLWKNKFINKSKAQNSEYILFLCDKLRTHYNNSNIAKARVIFKLFVYKTNSEFKYLKKKEYNNFINYWFFNKKFNIQDISKNVKNKNMLFLRFGVSPDGELEQCGDFGDYLNLSLIKPKYTAIIKEKSKKNKYNIFFKKFENSEDVYSQFLIFKQYNLKKFIQNYKKYEEYYKINNTGYTIRNFLKEDLVYPNIKQDINIFNFFNIINNFSKEFLEKTKKNSDYDYYIYNHDKATGVGEDACVKNLEYVEGGLKTYKKSNYAVHSKDNSNASSLWDPEHIGDRKHNIFDKKSEQNKNENEENADENNYFNDNFNDNSDDSGYCENENDLENEQDFIGEYSDIYFNRFFDKNYIKNYKKKNIENLKLINWYNYYKKSTSGFSNNEFYKYVGDGDYSIKEDLVEKILHESVIVSEITSNKNYLKIIKIFMLIFKNKKDNNCYKFWEYTKTPNISVGEILYDSSYGKFNENVVFDNRGVVAVTISTPENYENIFYFINKPSDNLKSKIFLFKLIKQIVQIRVGNADYSLKNEFLGKVNIFNITKFLNKLTVLKNNQNMEISRSDILNYFNKKKLNNPITKFFYLIYKTRSGNFLYLSNLTEKLIIIKNSNTVNKKRISYNDKSLFIFKVYKNFKFIDFEKNGQLKNNILLNLFLENKIFLFLKKNKKNDQYFYDINYLSQKLKYFSYIYAINQNFEVKNLFNFYNILFKKIILYDSFFKIYIKINKHISLGLKFFTNKHTKIIKSRNTEISQYLSFICTIKINANKPFFCNLFIKKYKNYNNFSIKLNKLFLKQNLTEYELYPTLILLKKIFNIKKNLHSNLGIFIEDTETIMENSNINYLGKNYNADGILEKNSEFTDGYGQSISQDYTDDNDFDLGYGLFYSDLKKSWLNDNYWFNDKWFLHNSWYTYNDWIDENWTGFCYFDFDDLSYDNELNTSFPYKNNLWFLSEDLFNKHKIQFDSDSLYNDFLEDSVDWHARVSNEDYYYALGVERGFDVFRNTVFFDDYTLKGRWILKEEKARNKMRNISARDFILRKRRYLRKKGFRRNYARTLDFATSYLTNIFNFFTNQTKLGNDTYSTAINTYFYEKVDHYRYFMSHLNYFEFDSDNSLENLIKLLRVKLFINNQNFYSKTITKEDFENNLTFLLEDYYKISTLFSEALPFNENEKRIKIEKYYKEMEYFMYFKIKLMLSIIFVIQKFQNLNSIFKDFYQFFINYIDFLYFKHPVLQTIFGRYSLEGSGSFLNAFELYLLCQEYAISSRQAHSFWYYMYQNNDVSFFSRLSKRWDSRRLSFNKKLKFYRYLKHPLSVNYQAFDIDETRVLLYDYTPYYWLISKEGHYKSRRYSAQNRELVMKLFLENDEIVSLQSTLYNFEKHKKDVDNARENYLKNHNIFIKLFFKSWWIIDDKFFIKYYFLNFNKFLENTYLKTTKYSEYVSMLILKSLDQYILPKKTNQLSYKEKYNKEIDSKIKEKLESEDYPGADVGYPPEFCGVSDTYREHLVYEMKKKNLENNSGKEEEPLAKIETENKMKKQKSKDLDYIVQEDEYTYDKPNINDFCIWLIYKLKNNEDGIDGPYTFLDDYKDFDSKNSILTPAIEADFWNDELDDWCSDETEEWVRNFEWYPLISDANLWYDISQIYNSSVELDNLPVNLENEEILDSFESSYISLNLKENIIYDFENLRFSKKPNKGRKKKLIYDSINCNFKIYYNNFSGNMQSIKISSNYYKKYKKINRNFNNITVSDTFYSSKNNEFISFDNTTGRYFNQLHNKYSTQYKNKLYFFNKNNLLNLGYNNLFFDIENSVIYKKYIKDFKPVYIPIPANSISNGVVGNKKECNFNQSYNIFYNLSDIFLLKLKNKLKKKIKLNRNLIFNYLSIYGDFSVNKYKSEYSKNFNLLSNFEKFEYMLNIKEDNIFDTKISNFNLFKFSKLIKKYNEFNIKKFNNYFLHFDLDSGKVNSVSNINDFFEFFSSQKISIQGFDFSVDLSKFDLNQCKSNENTFYQFDNFFKNNIGSNYDLVDNFQKFDFKRLHKKIGVGISQLLIRQKPEKIEICFDGGVEKTKNKFFYPKNKLYSLLKFYFLENKKNINFYLIKSLIDRETAETLNNSPDITDDLLDFSNENAIIFKYDNLRYLNFTKKIRQAFDLHSIFKNRKINYFIPFFANSLFIKKYAENESTGEYTESNFEKQLINNINPTIDNFNELDRKSTFYDIIILTEFLNYLRFGTNLIAMPLNGRIPFIDYVGWIKDKEDLCDGLGWTYFEDTEEVDMEYNDDIGVIPNWVEKKNTEFDYFYEYLGDRYDNFGFISVDDLEGSGESDAFWIDFNEAKRFEQTFDEDESEDEDLNFYNLEPDDIYHIDELDMASIQPDEELWEFIFDKNTMSDQLVRWADVNFEYNCKFIDDDEDFISYSEISVLEDDFYFFYINNIFVLDKYYKEYNILNNKSYNDFEVFEDRCSNYKNYNYTRILTIFKLSVKNFALLGSFLTVIQNIYFLIINMIKIPSIETYLDFLVYAVNGLFCFIFFFEVFFNQIDFYFLKNLIINDFFLDKAGSVYFNLYIYYKKIKYLYFSFIIGGVGYNSALFNSYILNKIINILIYYNNKILTIVFFLIKNPDICYNCKDWVNLLVYFTLKDLYNLSIFKKELIKNKKYLWDIDLVVNLDNFNLPIYKYNKLRKLSMFFKYIYLFEFKTYINYNHLHFIFNLFKRSKYNDNIFLKYNNIKYRDWGLCFNSIYKNIKFKNNFKYNYKNKLTDFYIFKKYYYGAYTPLCIDDQLDNNKNTNDFGFSLNNLLLKNDASYASNVTDPYFEKITNTAVWHNGSYYFINPNNGDICSVNNVELYLFSLYFLKINENTSLNLDKFTKLKIIKAAQNNNKLYSYFTKELDPQTGLFFVKNNKDTVELRDYIWNEDFVIKSNKHILKEKLLSFVKIKDNKNLESIKTDKNNFIFYENLIIKKNKLTASFERILKILKYFHTKVFNKFIFFCEIKNYIIFYFKYAVKYFFLFIVVKVIYFFNFNVFLTLVITFVFLFYLFLLLIFYIFKKIINTAILYFIR